MTKWCVLWAPETRRRTSVRKVMPLKIEFAQFFKKKSFSLLNDVPALLYVWFTVRISKESSINFALPCLSLQTTSASKCADSKIGKNWFADILVNKSPSHVLIFSPLWFLMKLFRLRFESAKLLSCSNRKMKKFWEKSIKPISNLFPYWERLFWGMLYVIRCRKGFII